MALPVADTICALATPAGVGALAVIRVSGPRAVDVVAKLTLRQDWISKGPNRVHLLELVNADEELLDQALVTVFHGPRSYTGEDVVEISCHGSPFIVQKLLEALLQAGARLAEAGEFTRRAFLAGKMDLSQAEAVADLIASESRGQHETALKQLKGGFSRELAGMREELVQFAALLELELDFSEEDVEFADRSKMSHLIERLIVHCSRLADSFQLGNALKMGVPTAIIGRPNAGKSTLMNALIREERALVSDIPGTTRDTIEEVMTIQGIRFRLMDTAGLRTTSDKIEKMGIERTLGKLSEARMVVAVFDASEEEPAGLQKWLDALPKEPGQLWFLAANKADRLNDREKQEWRNSGFPLMHLISARRSEGLDVLCDALVSPMLALRSGDQTVVTQARHWEALIEAKAALEEVMSALHGKIGSELMAFELRRALDSLGRITGEISSDEVLGAIFSKFCIGK